MHGFEHQATMWILWAMYLLAKVVKSEVVSAVLFSPIVVIGYLGKMENDPTIDDELLSKMRRPLLRLTICVAGIFILVIFLQFLGLPIWKG